MNLKVAISPCPNDTFIFGAIINGWIDTDPFEFDFQYEDIQTLNEIAVRASHDMIKISYATYPEVHANYELMDAGGALGHNCGPLLISKRSMKKEELVGKRIVLPGEQTTAHALFNHYAGDLPISKHFSVFSKIEDAVLSGDFDAGVIIHENRFTYEEKGMVKIVDLGEHWEKQHRLPVPLGGMVLHKNILAYEERLEHLIRNSLHYARHHHDQVLSFCRHYAQEMSFDVMSSHIKLYVNDYSYSLGPDGVRAIEELVSRLT